MGAPGSLSGLRFEFVKVGLVAEELSIDNCKWFIFMFQRGYTPDPSYKPLMIIRGSRLKYKFAFLVSSWAGPPISTADQHLSF